MSAFSCGYPVKSNAQSVAVTETMLTTDATATGENAMLTKECIQQIWDKASGHIPGCERHIAYARAIEAEVRAEAQEPVALSGAEVLAALYGGSVAGQQPPAPCPERAELPFNLEATELYELRKENKYLQAKLAEQVAEIARLQEEIQGSASMNGKLIDQLVEKDATIAQQAERIAELEKSAAESELFIQTITALCEKAEKRVIGQAALIEQCEKFASEIPGNGSTLGFVSETARVEALAAIAAHKKIDAKT